MALTGTSRGASFDETAAQTTAVVTPASNCTANALLVLWVAYDNSGTSGADPYTAIADTKSNTWTPRVTDALTDPGAANAGCVLRGFTTSQDGGALTTGDMITVSFGVTTVPVRAWTLEEWTAAGTPTYVTSGSSGTLTAGNATTTPTITSGSITSGHGISAAIGREGADAASAMNPGDSGNGSWSTAQHAEPSVATGNAGITIASARKITTGTGTQVFDATTQSRDYAAGWIEIEEVGAPTYTVTLSAGANGSLAESGSNPHSAGSITLTATPASGYQVASWTNTDDDSLKTSTNTLNVTANVTVSVTFEAVAATTVVAEYEPCYIDFGTAGTAYIQHELDATSELLDLISGVNADWSVIVPGYLLSSLNGNIIEAWDNVNNHRLLTLAIIAGSLVGTYYEDAEGASTTATCADAPINQHALYAISYDSSAKKITVMCIGESGVGISTLASSAITTPGDCTHIRVGTRTRPALKGGIGYVVFRNHQITLSDLTLVRDAKRITAPLDSLNASSANLGGTWAGKTYTASRFGIGITKVGAPDDLDGSSGTSGLPNGQSDATVAASNVTILDVDRTGGTSWISVSSVLTTVGGTMTYRSADYWRAGFWVTGVPLYGQATNPTAVNIAGPGPVFHSLAIGQPGSVTKRVVLIANSREQGTPDRKIASGITLRESTSGGVQAAAINRIAGVCCVRPTVSDLSDFGLTFSGSGRSKTAFSNINNGHSFLRFGRGAANGTLGPGAGVRGAVGGACNYQTLTASVAGSLYTISAARRHKMFFLAYPGGPVVDIKRYGSNTSIVAAGTQIAGGTSQVNCQTASAAQILAAPTVVTYATKSISAVASGAGRAITTSAAHGYSTGDRVTIFNTGLSDIDYKTWSITVTGATTFTLDGASGSGTSSSGTVNPCKIVVTGTGHNVLQGEAIFVASNSDTTKQCICVARSAGTEGGGNTTILTEYGFDVADGPPAAGWHARTGRAYIVEGTVNFAAGDSALTYQGMDASKASGDIGDIVILAEEWGTTAGGYIVGGSGWGGNGYTAQIREGHGTYDDPVSGITHYEQWFAAMDPDCLLIWPANNQGTEDPPSLWATLTASYRAAVGDPRAEVGWVHEWSRGSSTNPTETNSTSSPVSSTGGLNWQVYGSANASANGVFFITAYEGGGPPINQLQAGRNRDAAHNSILGYQDIAEQLFEAGGEGGIAIGGSTALKLESLGQLSPG